MPEESLLSEGEYLDLLELSFEVSNSLNGRRSTDKRLPDCQQLAAKLYFHVASVFWLNQGTEAPVPKSTNGSAFTDFPSIAVLSRAALETYLTLFEVFFEPISDYEFEFRHATWKLQGFILREGFEPSDPDLNEQYIQAQDDIRLLRERISSTSAFAELKAKQQKHVLRGRRLRSRMAVAEAAGFGKDYIRRIYHFLSDYAHSGGLSASQIFEAKTAQDQKEQTTMHLITVGMALSKQVLNYVVRFPEAKSAASRFPSAYHKAALISEIASRMP